MTTLATNKQIEECLVDDWENLSSGDEEDENEEVEEVEKEVYDPFKEEREASELKLKNLNAIIFKNNSRLEELTKFSKELLLKRTKRWFVNNKPIQGHWLYWLFFKDYIIKFPEKERIIVNGKSVNNNRGKHMIPQWKKKLLKKVNDWGKTTDAKTYTIQDIQTYYPTCIPAESQGPKSDRTKLLTATGAPIKQVQEYIFFKWEEIKEIVSKEEKEINEKIKKTQNEVNYLKEKIESLKY